MASRPLAIGLMQVDRDASLRERTSDRVQLALRVNELGYALIETVELGRSAVADEAALAFVERLCGAHDVQVLAVSGVAVDSPMRQLADRARLSIRRAEAS